jgi:ribosomal protein L16 Arg81 hydroxylase
MLPEPTKVRRLVRQGASLLLIDVDTLSPGLRAVADLIERALGGKVQINLYCSWRERQAFPSHFDTHDVFALHIAGAKRWTVYRGRADQPVDNPAWRGLGQAHHDRARGEVLAAVDLQPGDILYLPRGQYHDALATGENSIHLAVGVNEPIGLDVLTLLFEDSIVGDAAFRRRLPPSDDRAAVARHVADLAARAGARPLDGDFQARLDRLRAAMRHRRGGFPGVAGFARPPVKGISGN